MCVTCIRGQVDITEGIPKQVTVLWCKGCGRYLQPPTAWIEAPLESARLLTLCLKKLRGLTKVKLVDASFIWTEPHSRRLKVKVTIQKEVFSGTILQQSFVVEYIVSGQQCGDCQKVQAQNTWTAVAQVRQKVNHKRTFFYLEQLILKHNAHQDCINIKEFPDGLDFYFHTRSHAVKFVDFLGAVTPTRWKAAQKLISHDAKSNIYNYKYTYSVEIVPICKFDLIALPRRIASAMGSYSPLVLCTKVSNVVRLLDPLTLKLYDLNANLFWNAPFRALASTPQLIEFIVLDINPSSDRSHGKLRLADVQLVRERDFGVNDRKYLARTHLGNILKTGDSVLGYDVANAIFNDQDLVSLKKSNRQLPDVMLVRKFYPERNRNMPRHWRLKSLPKENNVDPNAKRAKDQLMRDERDYERFLNELEEDKDLRSGVDLYRVPDAQRILNAKKKHFQQLGVDDVPEVELTELLEELTLNTTMVPSAASTSAASASSSTQQSDDLQDLSDDSDQDMVHI
eukprot:CAMPEP_0201552722 /NCGR_PEP_ID=MMETSP0173_2-20130828/17064_1 /ASSEMBLY_ACC=CAM_ASM_000268 /TAXON_ID=218659 /ORGANISM="Vexillifera sp., Strain DIVA3 564/2" /LENGTH=510 /DNA_ID=CAMNT_0047963247 /DNA_START=92 /DNA_END=1624 /DNA_ORIENTATION=+